LANLSCRRASPLPRCNFALDLGGESGAGEVAELLEAKRIKRVPVMREGKIVGIISRANIVRAVGATKGTPQREGEADDRSIRAKLITELGREEWAQLWPRTLLSATGSFISGSPKMSLAKRGRLCVSLRKLSLESAASRNTPFPPR
jgi:CBS domain